MVSGTPKVQVQVAGFCPPTKWKSDRLVQACTACARPFNLFRRRHHCRCCGNIFCDICTQQRLDNVQGSVGYMERVCDACHKRTHVAEKKEVQPEKRSVESSHSLADSFMMTLSHKVDRHPKTKSTAPSETDRLEASEVGSSFPSNLKRERRIVLLGSSGVGKTRIAMQYATKSFATMYVPTIAQTWKKTVYTQQGINYEMVLLDTAGQSAYDSYQSSLSIGTNVYILIYSIFDRSTFTDAEAIYRKVLQCHPVGATFLLVGNKKDLEHSQGLVRTVSSEEGVALARSIGAKTRCLEISATIPSDVERVFDELFETLIVQGESEEEKLGMVLIREKRVPDEELILNFGFKMHDSHPEMEFS